MKIEQRKATISFLSNLDDHVFVSAYATTVVAVVVTDAVVVVVVVLLRVRAFAIPI